MKFCPKCGSIMMPKKEGSKTILACGRCSYKSPDTKDLSIKESIKEKPKAVEVIEEDIETLPVTDGECGRCGNNKAYYWEIQTRAADEPATKFLKCTKCKHIWRDYS